MKTLVLRIPDELAAELEAEARRSNRTKSEVARARLSGLQPAATGAGFDLIRDLVGTEVGGPRDISAHKKHYLKTTGYGREKISR